MSNKVYLSLGSNLGDRAFYINEAIRILDENPKVNINKVSELYETEPVGYTDQPWFYNAAAEADTDLLPEEFIAFTKEVENRLGRERSIKWGPRTVDIDILLFNGIEKKKEDLTLPHPRMLERAFVLLPLSEIAPELVLPNGIVLKKFIENLEKSEKIVLVKNSSPC